MADDKTTQSKQDRGDGIPRRKILTMIGGTIAGLPLLGQASDRIYGVPTSRSKEEKNYKTDDDVVRLQLARANIPTELWHDIISLNTLVEGVLKDSKNMQSFSEDPRKFLKAKGFQSENFNIDSLEMRMLMAVADQETNRARKKGDLQLFFRRLEEKKVFDTLQVSKLAEAIGTEFEKDYTVYMTALQGEDLSMQGVRSSAPSPPVEAAAVNVPVNVNVGVNVNVAVNVLAAVNAAAVVFVAIGVGVCGLLTAPVTHTKDMQVMVNNAARATHVARLISDRDFESRVLNHFINLHGTFIMDAMEELSFFTRLNVPRDRFREFLIFSIRRQLGVAIG
ncbi:MAG: hypothetical protein ACPGYT_15075 [Nitrospirales bacterium]